MRKKDNHQTHRAQLSYNRLATVAVAMAIGAPLLLGLIVVLTSII